MTNAYLYIEDFKFPIHHFSFNFNQPKGFNSKPSGRPELKSFIVDVEEIKNSFIREWIATGTIMKNGYIGIQDFSNTRVLFKWEFANAYAVNQAMMYSHDSNSPVISRIAISPGIIRINRELIHETTWNPNNPFEDREVTTREEVEEPDVISCQYLDMEGNPIDDLYEDKVLLEVKTENCVGKLVNIDLSDDEFDFMYLGKRLENDLLENLKITADVQRVELEVIEE